jgi:hypothetical protein
MAPAIDAAKIPRNCLGQSAAGCAAAAQTIKVDFVQDHRVRGDQFFPL